MSFEDDDFGSTNLLDLEPGHIRPQTLDKEVNLTPLIRERGGVHQDQRRLRLERRGAARFPL